MRLLNSQILLVLSSAVVAAVGQSLTIISRVTPSGIPHTATSSLSLPLPATTVSTSSDDHGGHSTESTEPTSILSSTPSSNATSLTTATSILTDSFASTTATSAAAPTTSPTSGATSTVFSAEVLVIVGVVVIPLLQLAFL
ncbi:unnamed protein product [Cyclocybe aegerita]|uniref:Uncharacterized protein n=1 Tax=Cyclocybe aegerita TaxID=1973307 RepID=A0A8S0WZG1_CYCAE|nr:unnamed protein product [Cyclocybe aegerita]